MRYVPTYNIKEDMTLGRNLYGRSGELLLTVGTKIKANAIEKIKYLGYCGIYINDSYSTDITVNEIIPDQLRKRAISEAREIFTICQKKVIEMQMKKLMEARIKESTMPLIAELVKCITEKEDMVLNLVDLKIYDEYILYHSVNVAILSIMLGQKMGLEEEMLIKLGLSGILHDLGTVFLGKDLFNRTDKLTKQEFELMKQHPVLGHKFIKEFYEMPMHTARGILQHHERLDGSGYPTGEKGDRIILFSRILGIADAYDALTSDRPYRPAMIPVEAIHVLRESSGTQYDGEIVEEAAKKIGHFPVGMCVELSNNVKAIVYENHLGCGNRPTLKVIRRNLGDSLPEFINLQTDLRFVDLTIKGVTEP